MISKSSQGEGIRGVGNFVTSMVKLQAITQHKALSKTQDPIKKHKNIKTINKRNEEYPILVNGLTGLTSPIKPRISSSEASLFPQTISVPHTATPRHSLPRRSRPFPLERRPGAKSDLKSFNGLVRIPTGKAGKRCLSNQQKEGRKHVLYI